MWLSTMAVCLAATSNSHYNVHLETAAARGTLTRRLAVTQLQRS